MTEKTTPETAHVEIIENSQEAQEAFDETHHSCANSHIVLTPERLEALQQGKCIAIYDGEYTLFINPGNL